MIDQLVIGTKASYDDFDASLKERKISAPAKKVIKETVPFSNMTYDFSKINGELYWEERRLDYVLEIIAPTPEELEEKKTAFSNWVMNVMNEDIHDPYDPNWHYKATYEDISYSDDESVEKTTATVVFKAYPYKIANNLTMYGFVVPAGEETVVVMPNDSSHRITPTLTANVETILRIGNKTYTIPTGVVKDDSFKLEPRNNVITIVNENDARCELTVEFYREVF